MPIDQASKEKMMKYRWAIFGILALAYFFVYFHRTSTAVVGASIDETFGVGAASIALLGSAYFYAYTAMQLPSGIFADNWGPRRTATLFIALAGVGALMTGFATDFWMVVVGRVIIGIGVAVIYIPIMRVLALWYRRNEFASLSGMLLLVGNVGAIAATVPLTILLDSLGGWKAVFLLLAAITFIIALLCWIIVKDHPSEMGFPSIEEIVSEETGEPIKESTSEKIPMGQALKMTFGSGLKFWSLAIWFFFMYGSIMVYQGLQAGAFYNAVYGWGKTDYSILLMMVGIGMIFGCPLAGILSDKILKSRKKVLMIGTVIYTAVWAVIWLTAGEMDSIIGYAVINFLFGFFGGFFVVSYAQIKELYPISIVGTSTAALNLFPFAGGAILMQVSGMLVKDKTLAQFQTLWLIMFACMILATVCAFLSTERKE